jgi:cyclin-dependent kinase 8/11
MKSQLGHEFLRETLLYDPDKRLTAHDALRHKWFQEEPRPTQKYASNAASQISVAHIQYLSAFKSLATHQAPPQRRITHDDASSMMPLPTQAQATQNVAQPQASQAVHALSMSHSLSAKSMSGRGSVGSVGTGIGSGGAGGNATAGGGRARKKPRVA